MGQAVLTNAVDGYAWEKYPSTNYGSARRISMTATGTSQKFGFIYFNRPFPLGATIISAYIDFYNDAPWAGSVTLSMQRAASKWSASRLNWNNKPGVTGTTAQVTKTDAVAGTQWRFDVKSQMQTIADGGAHYGWRVITNGTATHRVHSAQSLTSELRPTLTVVWSDAPEPPEQLSPAGGRSVSIDKPLLRFNFTDISGDTNLSDVNVQIAPTEAELGTATDWDSGWVATTVPELDLALTAYPGLADGSTAWWRVKVRDGAGVESGWSDATSFKRTSHGTLTIVSPTATTNDSTPPIDWTFTGRTQKHRQVFIYDAAGLLLWDSGKISTTDSIITPPAKIITQSGVNYTTKVRVWDTIEREATGTDTVYIEASQTFTYAYSATTPPATGLTSTLLTPYPWVQLDWSRSVQPDYWEIERDGEVIHRDEGTDLFVSGTAYRFVDRGANPRTDHTYKVVAVTAGVASASAPTTVARPIQETTLLCEVDGSNPVFFHNPKRSGSKQEIAELFDVTGDYSPVLILQQLKGFRGSVEGLIAHDQISGLSADQMATNLEVLRKKTGTPLHLYYLNMAMEVVAFNITWDPVAHPTPGQPAEYVGSFDFFEVRD